MANEVKTIFIVDDKEGLKQLDALEARHKSLADSQISDLDRITKARKNSENDLARILQDAKQRQQQRTLATKDGTLATKGGTAASVGFSAALGGTVVAAAAAIAAVAALAVGVKLFADALEAADIPEYNESIEDLEKAWQGFLNTALTPVGREIAADIDKVTEALKRQEDQAEETGDKIANLYAGLTTPPELPGGLTVDVPLAARRFNRGIEAVQSGGLSELFRLSGAPGGADFANAFIKRGEELREAIGGLLRGIDEDALTADTRKQKESPLADALERQFAVLAVRRKFAAQAARAQEKLAREQERLLKAEERLAEQRRQAAETQRKAADDLSNALGASVIRQFQFGQQARNLATLPGSQIDGFQRRLGALQQGIGFLGTSSGGGSVLDQLEEFSRNAQKIDSLSGSSAFGDLGVFGQEAVAKAKLALLPSREEINTLFDIGKGQVAFGALDKRAQLEKTIQTANDVRLQNLISEQQRANASQSELEQFANTLNTAEIGGLDRFLQLTSNISELSPNLRTGRVEALNRRAKLEDDFRKKAQETFEALIGVLSDKGLLINFAGQAVTQIEVQSKDITVSRAEGNKAPSQDDVRKLMGLPN